MDLRRIDCMVVEKENILPFFCLAELSLVLSQ
jgi:hypothetical protein